MSQTTKLLLFAKTKIRFELVFVVFENLRESPGQPTPKRCNLWQQFAKYKKLKGSGGVLKLTLYEKPKGPPTVLCNSINTIHIWTQLRCHIPKQSPYHQTVATKNEHMQTQSSHMQILPIEQSIQWQISVMSMGDGEATAHHHSLWILCTS